MTSTISPPLRPLPKIRSYLDTSEFWRGALNGKLMLQYCIEAGKYQHYPRPLSIYTGRNTLEWRETSGRGKIYSWTVTRSAWPGHEGRVPYICAYVDLEEQVRFLCNIVDCSAEALYIGMPVKVKWAKLSDEIAYPDFAPLGGLSV